MKKTYALLLFLFFHSYFCQSQPPDGDGERVEVVKMAYITRELNLSPQEAQNFWPVYNNYVNEIKQARNQYPNELDFEKKAVEIKERYQGNFKKVLGNSQRANKVYETDKKFRNTLQNELNNRQQRQNQNNQQPQQKQLQQQPPPNKGDRSKPNIKRGNGNAKRPRPPF